MSAHALLPLLYFTPARPGARVRVLTDRDARRRQERGLLAAELEFAAADADVAPADVLVVDLAGRDPYPFARAHAAALPPGGALLLLDWRASALRALLEGPGLLRGRAPAPCAGRAPAWEFLVEPSLDRPRHLVRPGFGTPIPAEYGAGWRRRLKRAGLFYFRPHHRATVVATPDAATLLGDATALALGTPLDASAVRRVYVSETDALVVAVESGGGPHYLRFPFTKQALARVRRGHEIAGLVRRHGFLLAPPPVHLAEAGPCPFQVEGAARGRPLPAGDREEERAAAARALAALREVHVALGRVVPLDADRFARHVGRRLEFVAGRAGGSPDAVGRRLREGLLHRRVLVSVCHGDFKLDNCLFEGGRPTGIVDWDLGSREDLALLDVTNLLCKLVHKHVDCSLADIAAGRPDAKIHFGESYRAYFEATGTDPVDPEAAVLLWWLDRSYKQLRFGSDPQGRWAERHVQPLLA